MSIDIYTQPPNPTVATISDERTKHVEVNGGLISLIVNGDIIHVSLNGDVTHLTVNGNVTHLNIKGSVSHFTKEQSYD